MPRPTKCRKVCRMPQVTGLTTIGIESNQEILMSIDEYETIRLIDLEGMSQEDCASHMGVARTTVQRIYNEGRQKLAQLLVGGGQLLIRGGDYELCQRRKMEGPCGHCSTDRTSEYYDQP